MPEDRAKPLARCIAYRSALEWIAGHFEHCGDLSESEARVLRKACDALGWRVESDEYQQVKLKRGGD